MSTEEKIDTVIRMLKDHTRTSAVVLREFQEDCQLQAVASARLEEQVHALGETVDKIEKRLDTIDRRNTGISAAAGAIASAVVMGVQHLLGTGKG